MKLIPLRGVYVSMVFLAQHESNLNYCIFLISSYKFMSAYLYREGVLQKSIYYLKCLYSKKYEIIFAIVKIFHCHHLELFID